MTEQKRRNYTQQFKIDAVRLITEQGYNYSEAARNLGINRSVLNRWKNEMESNSVAAFPGKVQLNSESEELQRLQKMVKQLGAERDIIKKAVAFFARESL